MADYFLNHGKKVIICGRTKSHLQTTSKELRDCPYYVLDTSRISDIPASIEKITKEHPELDCLVNNAGVQRPLEVNEMSPEDFLDKADNEILTNVTGPMHLAIGLLPHFKQKPGAVIMNVSSVLGYIPTSVINPVSSSLTCGCVMSRFANPSQVYNGTKAFVHFWSMNLRTQLEKAGCNIRIIEIVPPTVSTDLHRERKDPNDNKKEENSSALSLDEFMEDVTRFWRADKDVFGAGPSQGVVDRWHNEFLEDYSQATKVR